MSSSDAINPELRYPLFPKLNYEHSSIGVGKDSICTNERELRAKIKDLVTTYKQPVLIDEFIAGIEVTASVLDGINTKVYAVQRKVGESNDDVVTFDTKWRDYLNMSYEKYEDPQLKILVKEAFELLKMSDYARIDVRIDAAGRYYFIDPNANPFFGPPKETHATYSMIPDYGCFHFLLLGFRRATVFSCVTIDTGLALRPTGFGESGPVSIVTQEKTVARRKPRRRK
jgi:hypothetical protein